MKIRYGLILTLGGTVALMGCAGGASSARPGKAVAPTAGGTQISAGQPVRQDANTRAAADALKKAAGDTVATQSQPLYQQALTAANAAIAADTVNPLPYLQKGEALIGLGQYAQADSALTKAQTLRPLYQFEIQPMREHAWVDLYNKAAPLVNEGEYRKAAKMFEDADQIYGKRPEAMMILGKIYAQLHEDTLALKNLDEAQKVIAEQGPKVDSASLASWKQQAADIPYTKAQVLASMGRFGDAIAVYQKIVAADPSNLMMQRNLATIELEAGQTDSAKAILDSLMTKSTTAEDFYQLGIRYFQANAFSQAAKAFGKAATMSPMNRDALELWARSLRNDSAYAQVVPVAQRWLKLDPNNKNAYIILAQAMNQEKKSPKEVNALVSKVEALKVELDQLTLHHLANGGGYVTGEVTNVSLDPGANVTLHFTFYDDTGASIGTKDETVQVGAKGSTQAFRTDFDSSQQVGGYGYTLSTM